MPRSRSFARGDHFIVRGSNGAKDEVFSAHSATEAVAKVEEFIGNGMWCVVTQAATGKELNGWELRDLAAEE